MKGKHEENIAVLPRSSQGSFEMVMTMHSKDSHSTNHISGKFVSVKVCLKYKYR